MTLPRLLLILCAREVTCGGRDGWADEWVGTVLRPAGCASQQSRRRPQRSALQQPRAGCSTSTVPRTPALPRATHLDSRVGLQHKAAAASWLHL